MRDANLIGMLVPFTKMHGLGNDFVLLDASEQALTLDAAQVRRLADRHRGVGCDQVLLIEPAIDPRYAARYRIFNADGGEVEQCGNGLRCVADYLRRRGLAAGEQVALETPAGPVSARFETDGGITVDMGVPRFDPGEIPMRVPQAQLVYTIPMDDQTLSVAALSMGNPHAILEVPDVDCAPVAQLGPRLATHPAFPDGVNAGFMEYLDRARIRLRVFERGVGETLACGTGACAAVVSGRRLQRLAETVDVELPGGHLLIRWQGPGHAVWITGPAQEVFQARIEI